MGLAMNAELKTQVAQLYLTHSTADNIFCDITMCDSKLMQLISFLDCEKYS